MSISDEVWAVAGEVVPDDDDALGVGAERHGVFDGLAGAVAGLTAVLATRLNQAAAQKRPLLATAVLAPGRARDGDE